MKIVGTYSGFALDTLKTVRSKEVVESRLCIHEGTTTKQLLSLVMHQSIPAAPIPPPRANPRALALFLFWVANSRGWG